MGALHTFLCGTLTALAFVIGAAFARYYVLSRDRFFVFLAITFWVLGANWASLASEVSEEDQPYFYIPRLFAFLVLLAGIVDKNRRRVSEPAMPPSHEAPKQTGS